MDKIVEGLWDCPYCERKGIGGLSKYCPTCGHPQDEDTTFYLGEEKNYLDEETAQKYGKGADWTCSYCGGLNRYHAKFCKDCGAPKEENQGDYFTNQKKIQEKKEKSAKASHEAKQREAQIEAGKKKRGGLFFGILAVLVALLVFIFMPRHSDAKIDAKNWYRSIAVESYETVQEHDWSVPDGGRITQEKEEIHHYTDVLDHYETEISHKDNGDGTFTEVSTQVPVYREEPVYQTMYYYDIERWIPHRTIDTEGDDDEDPYWGELDLASNEREADRSEKYQVTIEDTKNGKTYTASLTKENWDSFKVGEGVELTTSAGRVTKINDTKTL